LITVQAGATWRTVQETLDPQNLSVAIMQDYANFTVGGTLSVNAHGSYVDRGPVINSVRSIRIVLADVETASRDENPQVFYGASAATAAWASSSRPRWSSPTTALWNASPSA
jgi:FAD/FMN-containing dehydrogenase